MNARIQALLFDPAGLHAFDGIPGFQLHGIGWNASGRALSPKSEAS